MTLSEYLIEAVAHGKARRDRYNANALFKGMTLTELVVYLEDHGINKKNWGVKKPVDIVWEANDMMYLYIGPNNRNDVGMVYVTRGNSTAWGFEFRSSGNNVGPANFCLTDAALYGTGANGLAKVKYVTPKNTDIGSVLSEAQKEIEENK